jgi:TonB family protein
MKNFFYFFLPLYLIWGCLYVTASVGIGVQEDFAIVPEGVLRNLAKKMVMPEYPAESIKQGIKGRAVAQVDIDKGGNLTQVKIVETPDPRIEQAVVKAIKKWKFGRALAGEDKKSVRLRGKLTFYFVLDGGRARVENPRKFQ